MDKRQAGDYKDKKPIFTDGKMVYFGIKIFKTNGLIISLMSSIIA